MIGDVIFDYMIFFVFFFSFCFPPHFHFPASGQAVVTGVVLISPLVLPSIFIAHGVQQSHCSSIFHRVLLTHALALSAGQFVHNQKSQRIYTSMHSAGLELTKLTHARLEDNLIRHRGDQIVRIVLKTDFFCQLRWDRSQRIASRSADTSIQNRCACWTDDQID